MHSVTKQEVVKYIRTSYSYLSKKGYNPKARPGVFGLNLDDSIERLAKGLGVKAKRVRTYVHQLMCEGVVKFVKNRLVISRDRTEINRKVPSLSKLTLIISEPVTASMDDGLPPEKSYLRNAWPEFFGAQPSVA